MNLTCGKTNKTIVKTTTPIKVDKIDTPPLGYITPR